MYMYRKNKNSFQKAAPNSDGHLALMNMDLSEGWT
jgi:hypothetical protein